MTKVTEKKKFISQSTAESLEKHFATHIHSILEKAGIDLMPVSIGGKFNREGVLLELGFLPPGSDMSECKAFIADRHIDHHDATAIEQPKESRLEKISRITGMKIDVVKRLTSDLPKRYSVGQKYRGKKGNYTLIGFSKKQDAFVMHSKGVAKPVIVPKAAFKKLEAIDK